MAIREVEVACDANGKELPAAVAAEVQAGEVAETWIRRGPGAATARIRIRPERPSEAEERGMGQLVALLQGPGPISAPEVKQALRILARIVRRLNNQG